MPQVKWPNKRSKNDSAESQGWLYYTAFIGTVDRHELVEKQNKFGERVTPNLTSSSQSCECASLYRGFQNMKVDKRKFEKAWLCSERFVQSVSSMQVWYHYSDLRERFLHTSWNEGETCDEWSYWMNYTKHRLIVHCQRWIASGIKYSYFWKRLMDEKWDIIASSFKSSSLKNPLHLGECTY